MKEQLKQIMATNLPEALYKWVEDTTHNLNDAKQLYQAFALAPRKVGKAIVHSPSHFDNWTIDRIYRVFLLASYIDENAEQYSKVIENMFVAADMNELIALYSALPLLAYPERWKKKCAEGIRSNIGGVLEAIMYYNPYPANYLEQPAWNQMILKAFFTEKDLSFIIGLGERNNEELANTLSDYVHERWAAGRTVNPIIWLLIGQFAKDKYLADFAIVLSGNNDEAKSFLKKGISLSGFLPAEKMINEVNTDTV